MKQFILALGLGASLLGAQISFSQDHGNQPREALDMASGRTLICNLTLRDEGLNDEINGEVMTFNGEPHANAEVSHRVVTIDERQPFVLDGIEFMVQFRAKNVVFETEDGDEAVDLSVTFLNVDNEELTNEGRSLPSIQFVQALRSNPPPNYRQPMITIRRLAMEGPEGLEMDSVSISCSIKVKTAE